MFLECRDEARRYSCIWNLLGFAAALLVQSSLDRHRRAGASLQAALFVNMTTADSWRGWMGLHFAHNTMKMGHPVTIFLNLDG